ncbi:GNAT family N-acetyltransferase [Facklamia hominis]|uniref:GNAT family N-acetyltransferase n=1 Tax=Facklamia hominis TaxID=178214 RepID=UPI0038FC2FA2
MFLSLKTLYRKRTVIWPFYFYTIIRTLSNYQNQGIGRRCIQAMIQLATEQALPAVKARIYRFNHRSRHLFESLGFIKIAEEWYQLDLPS